MLFKVRRSSNLVRASIFKHTKYSVQCTVLVSGVNAGLEPILPGRTISSAYLGPDQRTLHPVPVVGHETLHRLATFDPEAATRKRGQVDKGQLVAEIQPHGSATRNTGRTSCGVPGFTSSGLRPPDRRWSAFVPHHSSLPLLTSS